MYLIAGMMLCFGASPNPPYLDCKEIHSQVFRTFDPPAQFKADCQRELSPYFIGFQLAHPEPGWTIVHEVCTPTTLRNPVP